MDEAYIGEIRLFAGNYAPRYWAFCNGQLMSIEQHATLYSILGTRYGGDGLTTFALPDLRNRVPMHWGNGPGLTPRQIGEQGGSSTVTLTEQQMPSHHHRANASSSANNQSPEGAVWGSPAGRRAPSIYHPNPNSQMHPDALMPAGGGQPHNNRQPYLGLNFIICLDGNVPVAPLTEPSHFKRQNG